MVKEEDPSPKGSPAPEDAGREPPSADYRSTSFSSLPGEPENQLATEVTAIASPPATPPSSPLQLNSSPQQTEATAPSSSTPSQPHQATPEYNAPSREVSAPRLRSMASSRGIRRTVTFPDNPEYTENAAQDSFGVSVRGQASPSSSHTTIGHAVGSFVRGMTSRLFGLPGEFFQSRSEMRTWGVAEEELVDPSVQPVPFYSTPPAAHFPGSLPGYPPYTYEGFPEKVIQSIKAAEKKHSETTHPKLSLPDPIIYPKYAISAAYPHPSVGYDYPDVPKAKMRALPFPNALMKPIDPSDMYTPANPWTAYPYGVPAVEENEIVYLWSQLNPFRRSTCKSKRGGMCGCC